MIAQHLAIWVIALKTAPKAKKALKGHLWLKYYHDVSEMFGFGVI